MAVYLIECEIYGEQYTGSTKTKFRSRVNNYKRTQRKFVNKEAVPKQALKQKRFHEHYCSDRHNDIEDWVIALRPLCNVTRSSMLVVVGVLFLSLYFIIIIIIIIVIISITFIVNIIFIIFIITRIFIKSSLLFL